MSMKTTFLHASVFSAFLLLMGCNAPDPLEQSPEMDGNQLKISALPIIQDAVFELSASLNQQRSNQIMTLVCGLAQAQKTQQQVNELLRQQGVDLKALQQSGGPMRILIDGDALAQAAACAAFLATTVLSPVDVNEFSSVSWVPGAAGQAARNGVRIDDAKLAEALIKKLGIAKANADVFALIASQLQRSPGHTVKEYRDQARQLFSRLSPAYLQRVKMQTPAVGTPIKLLQMDERAFIFSSAQGTVFEFGRNGLVLRQNGIIWYGDGKLLGQVFPLRIAYFPKSINALLSAPSGL